MTEQLVWILKYVVLILLFKFIGLNIIRGLKMELPDKGFSISTLIGLLSLGYVSWVSTSILKIPFNQTSVIIILVSGTIISVIVSYKNKYDKRILKNWRNIVIPELIFYLFFTGTLIIRSYIPDINVIEDMMNYGIMNSLIRSEQLPPKDVWYSGYPINYYYWGHFLFAFVQKITQIPSAALYNIYFASIVASIASISSFIGLYVSGKVKASLFTPFILVLSGNLNYLIYVINNHSFTNYYYGNARNLVEHVITEFPAYSFILGNLHAHIINVQSVLLIIVFGIYFYKENYNYLPVLIGGIILGIIGMTNSWDLIIYLPLSIYLMINNNKITSQKKFKYILIISISSIVVMLPFLMNFKPPVSGIGFVRDWIPQESILTMFGMFFIGFILFVINFKSNIKSRLILIIFGYAFALIIAPQIIYLKDIYDSANPPFYKANTVFKLWYQAYILLSITFVPSIIVSIQSNKNSSVNSIINHIIIVVLLISTVFSITYSTIAYKYKIDSRNYNPTLRGDDFLVHTDSRKPMIDWLNEYVIGTPVILELPGEAYTLDSLVSSYTGLPTPIGWINHEFGWRNNWPEIALRLGDIEIIYTSHNPDEILPLIEKYQIKYVVISETEKAKYGNHAGQGIRFISEPVVKVGDDELLKITEYTL